VLSHDRTLHEENEKRLVGHVNVKDEILARGLKSMKKRMNGDENRGNLCKSTLKLQNMRNIP
jgi:hypothetical protein